MVAFNFSAEMAPKVGDRTKTRTIRRTARAKPGDALQLYTGQRTKWCRKLTKDDPKCTRVTAVSIEEDGLYYDGHRQTDEVADSYARSDGFPDGYEQMKDWFRAQYKALPFKGFEHRWEW